MGDLASEIGELKSINYFLSAIKGLPDANLQPCFNSINYKVSAFPSFKIILNENGVEVEKPITPDFLLWNLNNKIALIFEIKGGSSVEEQDIDQIQKYLNIPIDQIQDRVRNILEDPSIELENCYVGIVYYEETINSCLQSNNCINRINSIRNHFLILKQSPGDKLKIINPEFITFDNELLTILTDGIQIPLNPRRFIYMTENPSIEGTMWAIINYIHDEFFNSDEIGEIQVDPIQLRDVFIYSIVKLRRIKKALDYLTEINCCTRQTDMYYFNYDNFDNPEVLKEKIKQINTGKPPRIQRRLNP